MQKQNFNWKYILWSALQTFTYMFHSDVLSSILLGGHCSDLLFSSMFRFEVQAQTITLMLMIDIRTTLKRSILDILVGCLMVHPRIKLLNLPSQAKCRARNIFHARCAERIGWMVAIKEKQNEINWSMSPRPKWISDWLDTFFIGQNPTRHVAKIMKSSNELNFYTA